jgi:hypothetical protein
MYKKDQNHLWIKLTDIQQREITTLIEKFVLDFAQENAIKKCGGGTIYDYYRIQLEYLVLDLLEKTSKLPIIPLIIDDKNKTIKIWNVDKNDYITLSFEIVEDLYRITTNKKYE